MTVGAVLIMVAVALAVIDGVLAALLTVAVMK